MPRRIFDDLYFMRCPKRLYELVKCLRTHPKIPLNSVEDAKNLRRLAWGETAYLAPDIEKSLLNYVALQGGLYAVRHKEFYKMSILVAVELLARQYDVIKHIRHIPATATPERARELLSMVFPADEIHLNNIRKMRSLLRRSPAMHVFIDLMADEIDHNDEVHAKAYTEAIRRYFTEQDGQYEENSAVTVHDAVDAVHRTQTNEEAAEETCRDANHTAVDATVTAMIVEDEDWDKKNVTDSLQPSDTHIYAHIDVHTRTSFYSELEREIEDYIIFKGRTSVG